MAEIITKTFDIWTQAQILKTSNRGRSASNQSLLGIKRLRELILELAVRGKLVPQNTTDEPASALLKKILAEKKQLIKEGRIRKQNLLPEIKTEDIPFILPSGWQWIHLNDIGNVFNGNSISAQDKEVKYSNIPKELGLPFIATKDVEYGWEQLNYDNGIIIPKNEKGFNVAHADTVFICAEGGSAGKNVE